MSMYDITEVCKEDGIMSHRFMYQLQNGGFDLYCVCEITGAVVRLTKNDCDFRNNVMYCLKWNKGKGADE